MQNNSFQSLFIVCPEPPIVNASIVLRKPKARYQLYHEEKAKGGIGMTMFGGSSFVAPDTPSVFGQIDVSNDEIIPYFQHFAQRIRQHNCGIVCQISHLGRRTTWNAGNWLPVIAPSPVREPSHRAFPREMDRYDIKRVIAAYAGAAYRCKAGELDGTEILSHGHLPEQFLSPATNLRSDEYGGTLRNRLRFTLEMLQEVRTAVGDSFIVGIRLGANEDFAGGYGLSEGIEAAQIIEETGLVDYMTVNFGHIESHYALAKHIPGMWSPLAPWLSQVSEFRKFIKTPLIHACRIADIATARHAITENILDLVGMTRAHIADPHIVRKIEEKKEHTIRPCVGAGYCLDRVSQGYDALCLHNAATGREAGSRHPHDDWAPCSENGSLTAMHLLIDTLGELAEYARKCGATLALEPSVGTVVDTPSQIALVSEALSSRSLGFVADWPNLIDGSNIDRALDILSAMTAPLAGRVLLAHFKDANRVSGLRREVHHHASNADLYGGVEYPAPGLGSLDLEKYAQWLRAMKYDGAVIIEHVEEAAVPEAVGRTRAAFFQGTTSQVST